MSTEEQSPSDEDIISAWTQLHAAAREMFIEPAAATQAMIEAVRDNPAQFRRDLEFAVGRFGSLVPDAPFLGMRAQDWRARVTETIVPLATHDECDIIDALRHVNSGDRLRSRRRDRSR